MLKRLFFQGINFKVENSPIPFFLYIIYFIIIATFRIYLETFSDRDFLWKKIVFGSVIHYYLAFIFQLICIVLIYRIVTRKGIKKIAKWILFGTTFLIIVPALDLVISHGKGFDITYMIPGVHKDIFLRFVTFFGDFPGRGVTPGQRIEIAFALIGSFIYFFQKTGKVVRSFFGSVLIYTLIFSTGALPFYLFGAFDLIKMPFFYRGVNPDILFIKTYLVLIFFASLAILIIFCIEKRINIAEALKEELSGLFLKTTIFLTAIYLIFGKNRLLSNSSGILDIFLAIMVSIFLSGLLTFIRSPKLRVIFLSCI